MPTSKDKPTETSMTPEDWAKKLGIPVNRLWFDDYLPGLVESWTDKQRATLYIDRDIPPPSPAEMARRLARDRALQVWHTTPSITMPFEEWYKLVLLRPESERP